MNRDELIRRLKQVLFWLLALGGGFYFFVEFYLPQKMNQFGDVIERTREKSETDGPVSGTLRQGSPHYDPEIHRAYREEGNYERTYRLLKGKISADTASMSDYRLMIRLLESEKDVGLSQGTRRRRLSGYRKELGARSEE